MDRQIALPNLDRLPFVWRIERSPTILAIRYLLGLSALSGKTDSR
jgi:hypothetical protein